MCLRGHRPDEWHFNRDSSAVFGSRPEVLQWQFAFSRSEPAASRLGDHCVRCFGSRPADVAKLLGMIYRGEGLTKQSAEALVAILKKPKTTALRKGVAAGVQVADKPGTLEGVETDAGIVYLEYRPYVVAVTTTFLKENAAGETAITAVSSAAFDYFSRLAKSSEYGRAIRTP